MPPSSTYDHAGMQINVDDARRQVQAWHREHPEEDPTGWRPVVVMHRRDAYERQHPA